VKKTNEQKLAKALGLFKERTDLMDGITSFERESERSMVSVSIGGYHVKIENRAARMHLGTRLRDVNALIAEMEFEPE